MRPWVRRTLWIGGVLAAVVAARVLIVVFLLPEPATEVPVPMHGADAYGDPIPEGAIARLGTVRFRAEGPVAWTVDGTHVLARGWNEELVAFDAATGVADWTLPGHRGRYVPPMQLRDVPQSLAKGTLPALDDSLGSLFTLPGGHLLSIGGTLRVWDLAKRTELRRIAFRSSPSCSAVSADGKLVACATFEAVRVYDVATGERTARIQVESGVSCVGWTDSGDRVVAGLHDGRLAFARLDGSTPRYAAGNGCRIRSVAVVNGGRDVWTLDDKGAVSIRPLSALDAPPRTAAAPTGEPCADPWWCEMEPSPDGRTVAVAWRGTPIRWLDAATAEPVPGPTSRPGLLTFCWSPDGRRVAGLVGNAIQVFQGGSPIRSGAPRSGIVAVAISPDGRRVASMSRVRKIFVWDVETSCRIRVLDAPGAECSLAFAPDGLTIVAACAESGVVEFDAETGERRIAHGLDGPLLGGGNRPHVAPDGMTANWFTADGDLHVLRLGAAPAATATFTVGAKDLGAGPSRAAVASDLRRAVVSVWAPAGTNGAQPAIQVWHAGSSQPAWKRVVPGDRYFAVSDDGKRASFGDGEVVVLGLAAPVPVEIGRIPVPPRESRIEPEGLSMALFSPDGSRLAVADGNGVVRLYSMPDCREVRTLRGHGAVVLSMAFSADGRFLATGSEDTTALVWDLGH
jgi:WD40 repeat protein